MAEHAIVSAANAGEVASFARTRAFDEHGRELYATLARIDPAGVYVAKDEGTPIGIVIAHARAQRRQISELYVEPSFRGQGIGAALFAAAAPEQDDALLECVVPAQELGALSFLARRSLRAQMPLLCMEGALPHRRELEAMAAGRYRFRTEELSPLAHRDALAQLDRETAGSARADDHLYFSEHARGVIFALDEEIAGYAYVWPSGRVGPLACASAAYAVQFLGFALAMLAQQYGATWSSLLVPGSNLRVVRAALKAGLRIAGVRLYAAQGELGDLSRYCAYHELLF